MGVVSGGTGKHLAQKPAMKLTTTWWFDFTHSVLGAALQHTQEASEVLSDPTGRWWSFNIDGGHYLILEKKGLPEHLKSIENLDRAVTLASLLTDLEDLGEASWCSIHVIKLSSAW